MNGNTHDKITLNETSDEELNNASTEAECTASDTQSPEVQTGGAETVRAPEQKKNRGGIGKYTLACFAAFLLGGVLAAIRSLILFGEYDNKIALYPNGTAKTTLVACFVCFSVLLAAAAYFVTKDKKKYRLAYESTGMIFTQSLLAFSFAALAFSIFFASKAAQTPLSTFDSVMIALSLIAAVAFISEAFSKKDTLGTDASVILKLFGPLCCLFITFYFYFDKTTPIHNSNKKVATLAFAAVLLSLLYGTKAFVGNAKKIAYVCPTLLSVCYATAYAVPNLVWYFKVGSPLLLNVFFDFLTLALGAYSAMSLMSFELTDKEAEPLAEMPAADEPEAVESDTEGNDDAQAKDGKADEQ